MLRIRVDIVPHGDSEKARTVAELRVANDLSGDENLGHYEWALYEDAGPAPGLPRGLDGSGMRMTRRGRVERFRRDRGALALALRALVSAMAK